MGLRLEIHKPNTTMLFHSCARLVFLFKNKKSLGHCNSATCAAVAPLVAAQMAIIIRALVAPSGSCTLGVRAGRCFFFRADEPKRDHEHRANTLRGPPSKQNEQCAKTPFPILYAMRTARRKMHLLLGQIVRTYILAWCLC